MVSRSCDTNDRDSDVARKTDHFSRVIKEVMMAFYSDVKEVKNIEDMIKNDCKVIVLMRGLPGSGKSTLVHYLMETLADTNITKEKHVFSADDYFIDPKSNVYVFNRKFLREAHSWNVEAVLAAAQTSVTPIIVDNTNLTVSEMWPYACIAAKYDYLVRYLEPCTHWRYNIHECAKRNLHGVSEKHIARMMGRFDRSVSESKLLSLVSSQFNFQNYCDSHSNCGQAITKYTPPKHYAEDRCTKQLRSICIYNKKISKPSCTNSYNCSPNLPANILKALRTSKLPVAQQFVHTSFGSSSEFIKSLFSGGILSINKTCNIRNENQTCTTVSLQNNVFVFYDQIFKFMSFLHLFVFVRNVAICAAQFMSVKEMYDNRLSLEEYLPLTTCGTRDSFGCNSRGSTLSMILKVEDGVPPSVNINNLRRVVFPTDVRSLFLPTQITICGCKGCLEVDNRNKEDSHTFYAETTTRFPSLGKNCNVKERATYQANSEDVEDANSDNFSWGISDCSKSDSWDVCESGNYDPWDVSDSGGGTSWDMCGNLSWETETVTPNESVCVLPKPQRTGRKASIARHSREQNPVLIERTSSPTVLSTEEEKNCSLPKPRRSDRRPRTMQHSLEEYACKAESKIILSPELEAWNAVENPLSSWERKQSIESRNETAARGLQKSQNTSPVSRITSVKNDTVPPAHANEKEHLTSKPQREKRIRNR